MFYTKSPEKILRLGDVLQGYFSTTPDIKNPIVGSSINDYKIDVNLPEFCAVLDNCCHIGDRTILLSPLISITAHFWDPPFLANDILQINSKGNPKDMTHPREWNEKLTDKMKREYINSDPVYGYKRYFIYNDLPEFSPYIVKQDYFYTEGINEETNLPMWEQTTKHIEFETKRYMVDFKKSFRVNCNDLNKSSLKPNILDSKIAQLTIETRNQLREKLGFFFGEVPSEDQI